MDFDAIITVELAWIDFPALKLEMFARGSVDMISFTFTSLNNCVFGRIVVYAAIWIDSYGINVSKVNFAKNMKALLLLSFNIAGKAANTEGRDREDDSKLA